MKKTSLGWTRICALTDKPDSQSRLLPMHHHDYHAFDSAKKGPIHVHNVRMTILNSKHHM